MDTVQIHQGDVLYPAVLTLYLGNHAPKVITALGALDLLEAKALALFCSVKCPGRLILKTHDLAQKLKQSSWPVIGGFHSPVEQECLTVLLRSNNPIIVCPARGIQNMRISPEYKKPLDEGRMLLLSPFTEKQGRATSQMATYRNEFVSAIAARIFVAYAEPGGKTEQFCCKLLEWQKTIYTFASEATSNLTVLGVTPVNDDINHLISLT